jgi:hypothetical protein
MYNYDIAAYPCIYDGRELVYISSPNGRITEIYDIRNGRVEAGYSAALGGAWTPARFTQVMQNALYPGQTWVSDGNLNWHTNDGRLFAKLFWLNGNHVLRIALKNHIDRLGLWAVPTYTYSAPTQRGHARKIVSSKPKVTPRRELPVVSPDSAMTEL